MSDSTKALNTLAGVYHLQQRIATLTAALEEAKRALQSSDCAFYYESYTQCMKACKGCGRCAALTTIEKALKL